MKQNENRLVAMKRYFGKHGCHCCGHVLSGSKKLDYVSSAGGFWLGLCSETCVHVNNPTDMGTIHVCHLLDQDLTLTMPFSMPIDFVASRLGSSWQIKYEQSDYLAKEGDFVAVPVSAQFLDLTDDAEVNVYEFHGRIVTVTLDTTLRVVPLWYSNVDSREFGKKLNKDEQLVLRSLGEIRMFAAKEGILFAGLNFLTGDYDYAALL